LPAFIKSSKPWFFAWFSELTCICCIAQILSCFHTWNSVLSLDGTLESFSVLLGTLRLCQILWTVRNPASMSAFMKSSELWYFACFYWLLKTCIFAWFYGLLGPQLLYLILWKVRNPDSLLVSMDCSKFPLCLEPWNPSLLCLEPCVFDWFYGLLRNPDSLPVSMDYSEACFIICFYGLIGIHISGCF
jgi:hypothetical protein